MVTQMKDNDRTTHGKERRGEGENGSEPATSRSLPDPLAAGHWSLYIRREWISGCWRWPVTWLLKGQLKIWRLPVLVWFTAIFPFPLSFLTMCSSERYLSYIVLVANPGKMTLFHCLCFRAFLLAYMQGGCITIRSLAGWHWTSLLTWRCLNAF